MYHTMYTLSYGNQDLNMISQQFRLAHIYSRAETLLITIKIMSYCQIRQNKALVTKIISH